MWGETVFGATRRVGENGDWCENEFGVKMGLGRMGFVRIVFNANTEVYMEWILGLNKFGGGTNKLGAKRCSAR